MILLIDNYDSFVHNLARYVRELGGEAVVRRNDALTLDEVASLAPSHIILSPGPCTPSEAGISTDVVRRFGPTTPILGVCLGHQCIVVRSTDGHRRSRMMVRVCLQDFHRRSGSPGIIRSSSRALRCRDRSA
jgi:anthranilate synthase/aminodeoxychorismate synthase-like glutamine amidotransferase